ncbi:MAG: BatA domain-containing protein, partial [Longimicrobiales bacterium]
MSFGFAHPWALLLLLAIPLWIALARRRRRSGVAHSRAGLLAGLVGRRERHHRAATARADGGPAVSL